MITAYEIALARQANLIEYMKVCHPDQIFRHGREIRDRDHDSLVLYEHTYCRYSTHEVNDNIKYLVRYQGYSFPDAVHALIDFYMGSDSVSVSASDCIFADSLSASPAKTRTGAKKRTIYRPVKTDRMDLLTDYLHNKRGISLSTIETAIRFHWIYPASAYDSDYVCFTNEELPFYSLRNVSDEGIQKLQFSDGSGYWFFSSFAVEGTPTVADYLSSCEDPDSASIPVYACESAIDAMSLYELTHAPGTYLSMGGLKSSGIDLYFQEIAGFPIQQHLILAVDNDPAGIAFAKKYAGKAEIMFPEHKDWNEDLLARQKKKQTTFR